MTKLLTAGEEFDRATKGHVDNGQLLFVYDGFMDPDVMANVDPLAELLDLCIIPNKRLFFTGSKYSSATASVLPAEGKFIEGVIYAMSDSGMSNFAKRNGHFYLPKETGYRIGTGEDSVVYPCTYYEHRDGISTKGLPTKGHLAPIVNAYRLHDLEFSCLEEAIDFCCK